MPQAFPLPGLGDEDMARLRELPEQLRLLWTNDLPPMDTGWRILSWVGRYCLWGFGRVIILYWSVVFSISCGIRIRSGRWAIRGRAGKRNRRSVAVPVRVTPPGSGQRRARRRGCCRRCWAPGAHPDVRHAVNRKEHIPLPPSRIWTEPYVFERCALIFKNDVKRYKCFSSFQNNFNNLVAIDSYSKNIYASLKNGFFP